MRLQDVVHGQTTLISGRAPERGRAPECSTIPGPPLRWDSPVSRTSHASVLCNQRGPPRVGPYVPSLLATPLGGDLEFLGND